MPCVTLNLTLTWREGSQNRSLAPDVAVSEHTQQQQRTAILLLRLQIRGGEQGQCGDCAAHTPNRQQRVQLLTAPGACAYFAGQRPVTRVLLWERSCAHWQ